MVHGLQVREMCFPLRGSSNVMIGETGWCKDATLAALKAGYRHLDCACRSTLSKLNLFSPANSFEGCMEYVFVIMQYGYY
jgi:hypothetical protein